MFCCCDSAICHSNVNCLAWIEKQYDQTIVLRVAVAVCGVRRVRIEIRCGDLSTTGAIGLRFGSSFLWVGPEPETFTNLTWAWDYEAQPRISRHGFIPIHRRPSSQTLTTPHACLVKRRHWLLTRVPRRRHREQPKHSTPTPQSLILAAEGYIPTS